MANMVNMDGVEILKRNFQEAKAKVKQLSERNCQLEEENENLKEYLERTDEF